MPAPDRESGQAGVLPLPEAGRRVLHGPAVQLCLEAVRRSWRRLRLAEGAAVLVLVLSAGMVLLFGLDNLFRLTGPARAILLGSYGLLVLLALLLEVAIRPFRALSDEACALLYEARHPEVENRLINTVLFDRREFQGLEAALVKEVKEETSALLEGGGRARNAERGRLLRRVSAGLAALLCLLGYRMLLPEHFLNAAARYARPTRFVAPLSHTTLTVTPGHVTIGAMEKLRVVAEVGGQLPDSATLRLSYGAAPAMRFDGRSFAFEIEGQTRDFRYQVAAGDAESELFQVRVRRLPKVERVELVVHPPAYTGLAPKVEEASAAARVIRGSTVEFRVRASKPLAGGRLVVKDGEGVELKKIGKAELAASLAAERDLTYDFQLTDEEGQESGPLEFARSLIALPDLPPSVEVERPGRDLGLAPGEGLPLTLRVEDDVGLAEASLMVARPPAAEPGPEGGPSGPEGRAAGPESRPANVPPLSFKPALVWKEVRGQKRATPSGFLDLEKLGLHPGEVVLYRARAVDLKGQEAFSRPYLARLLSAPEAAAREREELERVRGGLADVLRRERALRGKSQALKESRSEAGKGASRSALALGSEQEEVIRLGQEVLTGWDGSLGGELRRGLAQAVSGPMGRASRALEEASRLAEPELKARVGEAVREEDAAIALLEGLLGKLDSTLAALVRGELPRGEEPGSRLHGEASKLRELQERVERFIAEEKKVVLDSRALEGKQPEDFTADEKSALEELQASQEKWGKYFADKKDDLSKVAPQDQSVGALAEEVVEIVEEIDLARDYLKAKNVELAVPKEQMGLGLAEKLETNLERWLARSRDNLKWNMEEPSEESDVPLADLPEELEDIVGELIDKEDLMSEETEDVTSSWLDSMDDGTGWDAMDGPISNMSAKGVTGNLQPNDMEIGGRSGEGRSGRSSGQFVEETASGKGGRPTPSRSTPDAFESGEVKDSSREAGSGATGGGKLAGAGQEGLRGAPSPEVARRMGALAERQAQVRQEAERLDHALQRRRYFSQDLSRAIDLMARMEKDLNSGRPYRYGQRQRQIVTDLRQLAQVVSSQLEHQLEAPPPLPKDLRDQLLNSAGEEMPREYRDAIRDYYRALAAPGSSR